MNERITLLALQASDPKTGWLDRQKFAELIVQECAKVILETPVKYTEIDIMHIIRDNVKEHFGVEE
mgnify:CR=1 FL=1